MAMKLKFEDPHKQPKRPKATIHATGKLGFNSDAADVMGLESGIGYLVATNEEDPSDENLYLVLCDPDEPDELCINVASSGSYYYLSLRSLFDRMGVDYENKKIIYDIQEDTYQGKPMYVLEKREKERNDS